MKIGINLFVLIFFLIVISSCKRDPSTFYASEQIPEWLSQKITEIENSNYYFGTVVYRHQWNLKFYYHIMIPVESCAFCKVYDVNGNKIVWSDQSFQDYFENRYNEAVIWQFESF